MALQPRSGRTHQLDLLAPSDGFRGGAEPPAGARLHFDKDHDAPLPGDDINVVAMKTETLLEDGIAFAPEQVGGELFRARAFAMAWVGPGAGVGLEHATKYVRRAS